MILKCLLFLCIVSCNSVIGSKSAPQCPNNDGCGGDRNAVFKTCPNPCPRTCQFPGGTGFCTKACLKQGCECKEGFYLDRNGKCVALQDCSDAKNCTANENFVFCNAGCPTNFCPKDDSRGIVACSPPFPCGSGCACKPNYLRLSSGDDRCIPAAGCHDSLGIVACSPPFPCGSDCACKPNYLRLSCGDDRGIPAAGCPPVSCTRPHEVWSNCPPPCLKERCSDIGTESQCDDRFFTCRPRCVCEPGYFRNDMDICVPERKCASVIKCGINEMPVKCKTICPPQSCENSYTEYACGEPTCEPGCDCLPGYLRNSKGICIPNDQCPPPPSIPICNSEQNEVLSRCKIVCPPQTCESIYTLYRCIDDIPCEWGCDCEQGFLRNSTGNCIPSEKCPTTPPPICGDNEQAVECRRICPPQTCESLYIKINCAGQDNCEPGCDCLDGYLRNSSGICIPGNQCFTVPTPTCGFNEEPSDCKIKCPPQTCESIFSSYDCSGQNDVCEPGCNCLNGYLRNSSGICVPSKECFSVPPKCGFNEEPSDCKVKCPPQTCDSILSGFDCTGQNDVCESGCNCLDGYLRNSKGICVPSEECFSETCGFNEESSDCKVKCPPQTCDSILSGFDCTGQNDVCESGCNCLDGYLRNSKGICVPSEECFSELTCGINEELSDCRVKCPPQTCNSIFTTYNCKEQNDECETGCDCLDGYLRNSSGICVPSEECFSQCSVPPECRPTCAVPNPSGCDYTPSETNQDGCNCQRGYVLSEVGGTCIEIEKCPTNQGCNGDPKATIKQCPPPCLSTCRSPNTVPCRKSCLDIGCECQPGYILSDCGRCILPDKCKGGNPCGPNGNFVQCRSLCATSFCPENDDRVFPVCETFPFSPCYSGCICNLNHRFLSRENQTCVRSDTCPPVECSRRHEHWTPCPMECSSGYCDEVDQPPVTCNSLVLNCNPQCTCDDTFFRDPKTDNCVSSAKCRKINKENRQ